MCLPAWRIIHTGTRSTSCSSIGQHNAHGDGNTPQRYLNTPLGKTPCKRKHRGVLRGTGVSGAQKQNGKLPARDGNSMSPPQKQHTMRRLSIDTYTGDEPRGLEMKIAREWQRHQHSDTCRFTPPQKMSKTSRFPGKPLVCNAAEG